MLEIYQGEIYFVNFEQSDCIGNEQSGVRPTVIISQDVANVNSGLVIVCPITSKKKKKLPTHYELKKQKYDFLTYINNIVLTENVRSISKYRLERKLGQIDKYDLNEIIKKLNKNFN